MNGMICLGWSATLRVLKIYRNVRTAIVHGCRIGELRQRYLGTKLLIRAYETGSFNDGGPNELGLGWRHYLQTELIVLSASEIAE